MNTRMNRLILACLLFGLLVAAPLLHAQEATPEATVEATVDPEAESTQIVEAPNAPGAEEAETDSAIGDAPLTTGEQPGDITSGSSVETPLPPQSGTTDEMTEGEAPVAADVGEETQEAETSLEGEESTAELEEAEAPAESAPAPGVTVLALLLGLGAVFFVGGLTMARSQPRSVDDDDDPNTPE